MLVPPVEDEESFATTDHTVRPATAKYFLGFEVNSCPKLQELWQRLEVLEKWNELAVRPQSAEDCHPEDRFLLAAGTDSKGEEYSQDPNDDVNDNDNDNDGLDDLLALQKQWSRVRDLFNDHLTELAVETTRWEPDLVVRPSQIPNAGMGLYYDPGARERTSGDDPNHADGDSECAAAPIPAGSLVCYYTGHVHTHSSARRLADRSYLMWIRGNTLVDPAPLPNITARYINDPLNEQLVNCRFVPTTLATATIAATTRGDRRNDGEDPHPDTIRTSVYTTRSIQPGEELFVRYGDAYWKQQPIAGNTLTRNDTVCRGEESETVDTDSTANNGPTANDSNNSNDNEDDDDNEDDMEATFPFSSCFDPNVIHRSFLLDTRRHMRRV